MKEQANKVSSIEFRDYPYIYKCAVDIDRSTACDVPNPYSVPGCTCLPDKSPKLFHGKAQFKLSLERICAANAGDETADK